VTYERAGKISYYSSAVTRKRLPESKNGGFQKLMAQRSDPMVSNSFQSAHFKRRVFKSFESAHLKVFEACYLFTTLETLVETPKTQCSPIHDQQLFIFAM